MQLGSDSTPGLPLVPAEGVAQMGGRLTFGPSAVRVFQLGAYVRAVAGIGSGPIDYRLCLWSWDGGLGQPNKLLGRSYLQSVGQAAVSVANLVPVTWYLEEPVELPPYADVLVGVAWETSLAHQMMLGCPSGSGIRYRKELAAGSGWPVSMKDSLSNTDHNLSAWVEDYEPASGVWVYRSGAWTELEAGATLLVKRDGVTTAAPVRVRRSGEWITVRPAGG